MKLTVLKRSEFGEWKTSLKCVDNVKFEDPFRHQRDSNAQQ